ncbi:hypothetical protein JD844_010987 [Phrynosoma platyrhinos]|uniref:Uncharacterized protein n=1 Tax=Phrynosoma platyrhinos TaxID=52577 RepID=A0ABQ7THA5_PHRPL|nr:hypothetical protein JD844_010987 [Phrynosoma platyrhinos]
MLDRLRVYAAKLAKAIKMQRRMKNQSQFSLHTELRGLVNNAGIVISSAPNEWLTKDDFAEVILVSLLGLIDVTLHMLPLVRAARGRVINIASVFGRLACLGRSYSPSKYGVEAFSDSLSGLPVSSSTAAATESGAPPSIKASQPGSRCGGAAAASSTAPGEEHLVYGILFPGSLLDPVLVCKTCQILSKGASSNIYLVTDSIEHALTSLYPRTRYAAGWDAKLFYIRMSYLPTSLADSVLNYFMPKPAQAV